MRPTHQLRAAWVGLILVFGLQTSARADLLGLTGNAVIDLPTSDPGVFVIQDRVDDVAQANWMTSRGWTTGWNMQDLRVRYDSKTDALTVGVNFIGIAGDSDGNGDPGTADPLTTASGGLDLAHLGGRKSISVGFARALPNGSMGSLAMVAGVSAIKTPGGGGGIDGFKVASLTGTDGLPYGFGASIPGVTGDLAFDPSAAHPDFVFVIENVSRIAGFSPSSGYWISAFAGSPDDVVAGEDTIAWTRVPPTSSPQVVPEPSSVVLLAIGGAIAWNSFRRRRSARRS